MFGDYSSIISDAKYTTKHGEGLKILTTRQMLQRLPIALAQVKAGNTSVNLLNKIIFYTRYSRLFWIYIWKKHGEKIVNPSIKVHIIKIENIITFKIKTGYYLELSTLETMKLLGSTKSKTAKYENGENVPYLEITELVLIYCNVVDTIRGSW